MDMRDAVMKLAGVLSQSNEFAELKRQRNKIAGNVSINSLLEQFQKKQAIPYQTKLSQPQLQLVMEEIDRDYEKLSAVPEIKKYFTAAESFNQLLNSVVGAVNEELEKQLVK